VPRTIRLSPNGACKFQIANGKLGFAICDLHLRFHSTNVEWCGVAVKGVNRLFSKNTALC
jgi:hypothetical protein